MTSQRGRVAEVLRPYLDMPLPGIVAEMRACAVEGTSDGGVRMVSFGPVRPSGADAVVCLGPFGGDVRWRNPLPLIRAFLIQKLLTTLGNGPVPTVVALPGPSVLPLVRDPAQVRRMASGEFAGVADLYLAALTGRGIERICLSGFSQGASLAAHIAARAPAHAMTVDSLALADPPGLSRVSRLALISRYLAEGPKLAREVARNPLPSYREAYRLRAGGDRVRAAVGKLPLSLALARGHSGGSLAGVIRRVLAGEVPTSIAVGGASRVSPAADAVAFLDRLPAEQRRHCEVLTVVGRHHGWLHDTPTFLESVLVHLTHKSAFGPAVKDPAAWPVRIE